MNDIAFIGDIEGEYGWYLKTLDNYRDMPTLQLGDLRIGFPKAYHVGKLPETLPLNHMFIRGNHDKPLDCRNYPNYIGDYGFLHNFGIFYAGGAHSIDWQGRKEGYNYWKNEEQIAPELWTGNIIPLYEKIRPKIVVTHDAPWRVVNHVVQIRKNDFFPGEVEYKENLTTLMLDRMFDIHKPDIWVFGHHHFNIEEMYNGTLFKCIPQRTVVELRDLYEKL